MRDVEVDERSLTAHARARPARPRGGGGAERRAASRSATSRSPSTTRRSAASPRRAPPGRPRAATGASTSSSPRSRCTTPARRAADARDAAHRRRPRPARADLGSEGTLGVITDVTVRVRPLAGRAPLRGLVRCRLRGGDRDRPRARPGRLRCPTSSASPTARRPGSRSRCRAPEGIKKARPRALPEPAPPQRGLHADRRLGGRARVGRPPPRALAARRCAAAAPSPLGRSPGRAWEHGRYEGPYLRDPLMDAGVHRRDARDLAHLLADRRALRRRPRARWRRRSPAAATPGIVMCHVSHAYRDGASLYFTFLCAPRGRGAESSSGATSSRPPARRSSPPAARSPTTTRSAATTLPTWRPRSASSGSRPCARVKERLDPAGIMNPGKLLPG